MNHTRVTYITRRIRRLHFENGYLQHRTEPISYSPSLGEQGMSENDRIIYEESLAE